MARPRLHDDALRTRLLEVASEVVSTAGTGALTVRDVATRAGTSASAVYALFGSRDALVAAIGDEAFRRFGDRLDQVPRTDDPAADLLALGLAYRESAVVDPHFYRVMFDVAGTGARTPGGPPSTERTTFVVLRDAVARVVAAAPPHVPPADERSTGRTDVDEVALALWAHTHGLVSLELAGLLPGDAATRAERYATGLALVGPALLGVDGLPSAGHT